MNELVDIFNNKLTLGDYVIYSLTPQHKPSIGRIDYIYPQGEKVEGVNGAARVGLKRMYPFKKTRVLKQATGPFVKIDDKYLSIMVLSGEFDHQLSRG